MTLLAFVALSAPAHADLAGYRAAVMNEDPLAYWHLDETSGTVAADSSGNAAHGTLGGDVTLAVAAPFGGPANTASKFGPTGTMTAQVPGTMKALEFWVRPSRRVQQTLLRFGDPATAGWSISMTGGNAPGNQKRRLVFTAGGKVTNSKIMLPVGAWSMVSVSWGPGNQLRVALNGGAVSKSPAPGGLPDTSPALGPLVVGPGAGTGGTSIDEVALFTNRPDPAAVFAPSTLPVLLTEPVLSPLTGVKAGQALTLTAGIWSPGTSVGDEWQRCDSVGACQPISGTSGAAYVTQAADAGFAIQVQETGTSPSGAIVVYTETTDPIAQADGTTPPAPPVLPPGTDPAVPPADSQAALDAGGLLTDPSAPPAVPTTGGTPSDPATGGATVVAAQAPGTAGGTSTPTTGLPAVCKARLQPRRALRGRLRVGGRLTIRVNAATRTVSVRARRRAVRRVRWTLDRSKLTVRGRGTSIRLRSLRPGVHSLRATLTPAHGKRRSFRLKLVVRCA